MKNQMITGKWPFIGLILLLILSLLAGCARLAPVPPPIAPQPPAAPPTTTLPPTEPSPPPTIIEVDQFPQSLAQVTVITPTGQASVIDLEGPTTVHVFFEGTAEGEASDNDGDGRDEVSTEIVAMSLTGDSPMGSVEVRLNPDIASTGEIEEISNNTPGVLDLPPFAGEGTANSFFDVYFELEMGEFVFRTDEPKRMETIITHKPPQEGDTYQNPVWIPLVDLHGQHTGFFVGPASHTPNPPPPEEPPPPIIIEVDQFPQSLAQVTVITPTGQASVIDLEGPTTVHVFFEGTAEGEASDNDGDGRDEVSTEIVAMSLTGDSPMGSVEVRLNPDIASTGEIEEISNNTPGVLDLPPFAGEGTANSFFDVYFELEMGEFVFRTDEPKRMETIITHKPPQEGDTYQNPVWIPLVDLHGQHTGFFVGPASHTPNPLPPELPPPPPEEPPPAEETLYVGFMLSGQCTLTETECVCTVSYSLDAEDRSAGDKYPVTNVILEVNDGTGWKEWYNSEAISTSAHHYSGKETGVDCYKTFDVRVTATNSIGQTLTSPASFTTTP